MKLSLKMTLSVLLLLAICLSISGYLMTSKNFDYALKSTIEINTQNHYKDIYRIEIETPQLILEQLSDSGYFNMSGILPEEFAKNYADKAIQQVVKKLNAHSKNGARGISIRLKDGSPIYSNMPSEIAQNIQIKQLANAFESCSLLNVGDKIYMLMSSPMIITNRDVYLVSAFDVSFVFNSRTAQLKNLVVVTAATLLVGVVLIIGLSTILTKPLKKLEKVSESIAGGNYEERTGIHTDDEIGSLSKSLDKMAQAVEDNIGTLKSIIEEREYFIAAFTHEIKTPMTSMLGYGSLLRKSEQAPEQQRAAADFIWRETKRLEALSHKLMILAGLKEDTIELESLSVNRVFSTLKKTLPRSNVTTNFQCEDKVKVLGDSILLDDMLRNLIINAQRACKTKGEIIVSCVVDNSTALFKVIDTGCGISNNELPRITEPFYMVDKSRARADNGSGLGLALCARIAQLHSTKLEFISELNVGTTVSFAIPLVKEAESDATAN